VTAKGLLSPTSVIVRAVDLVSIHRRGNRIEEVATGEVTDPDEVLIDYGGDEWEAVVLPVLRGATATEVARRAGMDRAGLSDYLRIRARRRPPPATERRLCEIASAFLGEGVVRRCALSGCSAWARPLPSVTCSERHRNELVQQ
jgi:hypothetical protein